MALRENGLDHSLENTWPLIHTLFMKLIWLSFKLVVGSPGHQFWGFTSLLLVGDDYHQCGNCPLSATPFLVHVHVKMYHSIVKHNICLHLSIWFAVETCLMVLNPRLWSLWTLSEHSRLISIEVSSFIAVGTFWGCVVRFWYHCQQNN